MGIFGRLNRGGLYDPLPPVKTRDLGGTSATSKEAFQKVAPDLTDRYDGAKISLEKRGAVGLRAAVYLVLDRSGSMSGYYRDDSVQDLADRVLSAAAHFDDDGVVPTVFFGSNAHPVKNITLGQHRGRVQELHTRFGSMGSTNYADAMETVIEHYRSTRPKAPALVFFQTDGAPNSQAEAEAVIVKSAGLPIFWQFIGFGSDSFTFLRRLDALTNRVVDNAGFFAAGVNPRQLTDATLYDNLLGEYPQWVEAARSRGIVLH